MTRATAAESDAYFDSPATRQPDRLDRLAAERRHRRPGRARRAHRRRRRRARGCGASPAPTSGAAGASASTRSSSGRVAPAASTTASATAAPRPRPTGGRRLAHRAPRPVTLHAAVRIRRTVSPRRPARAVWSESWLLRPRSAAAGEADAGDLAGGGVGQQRRWCPSGVAPRAPMPSAEPGRRRRFGRRRAGAGGGAAGRVELEHLHVGREHERPGLHADVAERAGPPPRGDRLGVERRRRRRSCRRAWCTTSGRARSTCTPRPCRRCRSCRRRSGRRPSRRPARRRAAPWSSAPSGSAVGSGSPPGVVDVLATVRGDAHRRRRAPPWRPRSAAATGCRRHRRSTTTTHGEHGERGEPGGRGEYGDARRPS